MNAAPVRRCVLYARISLSKEESVSVERQLTSARRYAEGRGWEVVGEFIDDGVSATANRPEDRKGWTALLAAGGFDAVVIWKVDRLARRVLDFLHVDEVLRKHGAGLVAVEDPIDMTTPMGRAFATILAVFGEMEAAAIAARVRAAREHLAKEGRWGGGGIPYGYMSAPNPNGPGRVLVKDPDRVRWMTKTAHMALNGMTVYAITKWLTDNNAPKPVRRETQKTNGNTNWNYHTVDRLLRNPMLAGMMPRNPGRSRNAKSVDPFAVVRDETDQPVVNEALAVITVEEFTMLQNMLNSRTTPQTRKQADRKTTSPLLSRVAVCVCCDVIMYRGTNQKRPVLYCPKCKQSISRATLDPYLIKRLLRERGREPYGTTTVRDCWNATTDDATRREILLSQLDSLRILGGVVGRHFDKDRVRLQWRSAIETTERAAA